MRPYIWGVVGMSGYMLGCCMAVAPNAQLVRRRVFVSARRFDWSVVVRGRWNRAILTPAGIGKYVLGVAPDTPVGVEVPIDGVACYRVRDLQDKLIVTADEARVQVLLNDITYETLELAMKAGARVLGELPVTPVSAAGINLCFGFEPAPELAIPMGDAPMDTKLAEAGFSIRARNTMRTMPFEEGLLNVTVRLSGADIGVVLNLHRGSAVREDLKTWLEMPVSKICETATRVLGVLGLAEEEAVDESDGNPAADLD